MFERLLVVTMIVAFSGCGPSWKAASAEDAFRATALKRASFELGCPAEQVRITPLGPNKCQLLENGVYVCTDETMGVEGCGKKTTYRTPPLGQGGDWVRDSEVLPANE